MSLKPTNSKCFPHSDIPIDTIEVQPIDQQGSPTTARPLFKKEGGGVINPNEPLPPMEDSEKLALIAEFMAAKKSVCDNSPTMKAYLTRVLGLAF